MRKPAKNSDAWHNFWTINPKNKKETKPKRIQKFDSISL